MKSGTRGAAEKVVKDILRRTRRQHSSEEKLRIVQEDLRGAESISELCRRGGIPQSLYYTWSEPHRDAVRRQIVDLALEESELSPRELAVRSTDTKRYFVSEAVLDDDSRYIVAWRLCTTMRATDLTDTLEDALAASGCDHATVVHRPRLLSDNVLCWELSAA